jgi:glycine/D-amino acid oxidase-like deaminating enzyme
VSGARDLVVVGAGVVGASIAYHAARLGARVTLVDRGLPGSGVTGDSFAWIGASGVPPGPVAALRRSATDEYRRLEDELPGVRVRWTGSLSWPHTGALDGQVEVDAAAVARLEPHLRVPPGSAVHVPGDGAVDPVAVTEALVAGAGGHGAAVVVGSTVTALRGGVGRCRGVDTSAGPVEADAVVLAVGTDALSGCAPSGSTVPVVASPAVLVRLAAPQGLVRTLLATPDLELRQAADGMLLVALAHHGEVTQDDLRAAGHRALARVRALLHGAEGVRLVSARIGWRPVPVDGEPVLGPVPGTGGAYLAVLHSGVSLGAAVGRLVAQEVVLGEPAPELQGCRPDRSAAGRRARTGDDEPGPIASAPSTSGGTNGDGP